jgi:hypothetical protein
MNKIKDEKIRKKKINLSLISEEDMHAELNKRHVNQLDKVLKSCVAKCCHYGKGAHLKRWYLLFDIGLKITSIPHTTIRTLIVPK